MQTPSFLIAVDPSLTASGWACFSLASGDPIAVGLISPPGATTPLANRLAWLQDAVTSVLRRCPVSEGDVLICEGPAPLVRNPQSALKVEGVRGIFEAVARAEGLNVPGRINPRTVQSELLGMRGKQLARAEVKAWARATAMRLYGTILEELLGNAHERKTISQDILDALLIGTVAATRIQLAVRSEQPLESAFLPSGRGNGAGGSRATGWSERVFRRRFSGGM